jgi:hypothetical protein
MVGIAQVFAGLSRTFEEIGPPSPPLRCPVQGGSAPWHRLVLPHLEDAPGSLDTVTGTPSRDEGAREGGVGEIDR